MGLAQPPEYTFLPSGIPTKGEALLMCFFTCPKKTHQQKQPLGMNWNVQSPFGQNICSTPPKKYYIYCLQSRYWFSKETPDVFAKLIGFFITRKKIPALQNLQRCNSPKLSPQPSSATKSLDHLPPGFRRKTHPPKKSYKYRNGWVVYWLFYLNYGWTVVILNIYMYVYEWYNMYTVPPRSLT